MTNLALFVSCVAVLAVFHGAVQAEETILVKESDVVCKNFLGFGAEWDSDAYDDYTVTDEDFEVIAERIRWMRMPVVRVMMLAKWCCLGEGRYDWDTGDMRMLRRHLDLCQKEGITVLLTDWGCERDWLRIPGVKDFADPEYAARIGAYMDYLVNQQGYTCIEYFILGNEPNYEVADFDRWKQGVENVVAEFKRRGLEKVRLAGPDESNAPDWHRRAVDELHDVLGAYDRHYYAPEAKVRPGQLEDYFKTDWDYALAHDPDAANKPFIVGEAGQNDDAEHPVGNKRIDSFYYGLFMADYAVQAARAGSAAVCAWMMDDNGHKGFYWGLWDNNDNGLRLRPWFYTWGLLSRYVPKGATVHAPAQPSEDWRILAASAPTDDGGTGWTFCLVNRGEETVETAVRMPGGSPQVVKRYVYAPDRASASPDGFPLPASEGEENLAQGLKLTCPPGAVLLATTLPW